MAEWTTPTAIHSRCGAHASYPAELFIDNATGLWDCWICEGAEPHWIIFDMGSSKVVEEVRVYLSANSSEINDTMKCDLVDVYVSDNPEVWGAAVATNLTFADLSQWNERDVMNKVGRYIKFDDIYSRAVGGNFHGVEFDALLSEPYQANDPDSDTDVATREDVALAVVA